MEKLIDTIEKVKFNDYIIKLLKAEKKKYYSQDFNDFKPELQAYTAKIKALLKRKRVQLHKVYLVTMPA